MSLLAEITDLQKQVSLSATLKHSELTTVQFLLFEQPWDEYVLCNSTAPELQLNPSLLTVTPILSKCQRWEEGWYITVTRYVRTLFTTPCESENHVFLFFRKKKKKEEAPVVWGSFFSQKKQVSTILIMCKIKTTNWRGPCLSIVLSYNPHSLLRHCISLP